MCTGLETIAIAGLVGSALSTGVGMIGAKQSADAASASANYQAQVAQNNATIARQNADLAQRDGTTAEQNQRFRTAQTIGAARAQLAANGQDLQGESALDVQSSTASMGELDALTIRNNTARQVWGFTNSAADQTAQAGLYRSQAASAESAGNLKMFSTFLSGASQFGKSYADSSKQFGW